MRYEQDDLLEKFIQNEKRSKFWALVSAAAFILVGVSVVYIAKEIKGDTKVIHTKGETVTKEVKDSLALQQLAESQKSVADMQQIIDKMQADSSKAGRDLAKEVVIIKTRVEKEIIRIHDSINKVSEKWKTDSIYLVKKINECNDSQKPLLIRIKGLQDSLNQCLKKRDPVNPPGIVTTSYSIQIFNIANAANTAVLNQLQDKLRTSKAGKADVRVVTGKSSLKPFCLYYYYDEDVNTARYFLGIINEFIKAHNYLQKFVLVKGNAKGKMPGTFEMMFTDKEVIN